MKLSPHERMLRMFQHKPADRIPIADSPWGSTIARWRREGMPDGVDYTEYFDLDPLGSLGADYSPRYPVRVLEETDQYKVVTTSWGATIKNWKHETSTPEFIDFTIKDPDSWLAAKARMTPSADRVNWDKLDQQYKLWRQKDCWIRAGMWFGFDVTHSWTVGTERLLIALIEQPDWCVDMFNTFLDLNIAMLDMVWERGYRFDSVMWPDDLGYKQHQFMSVNMYRQLLKPVQKRACEWAHAKGVYTHLHSCGDVRPFVPEWIEIGIDCLNPLEVKAGMDPLALKARHGDQLAFHGGINAVLWDKPDLIAAEMEKTIPTMKQNGGYIFASDHSIPSAVSLADFRRITDLAKKLGSYE